MSRYVAQMYDRCGFLAEREATDIRSAITAARALRVDYPTACLVVANLDEVDLGRADGLTDEERELVHGAVT